MTIRVFTCGNCGHHMRLSGQICNKCRSRKRFFQLPLVFYVLLATPMALTAITLA